MNSVKELILALEAAWRVKKYCAGRICPDCRFYETVKDKGRYFYQCGLAQPPEGWRLNIKIAEE